MKKLFFALSVAGFAGLALPGTAGAAESHETNAPVNANTNIFAGAIIPDAAHPPVRVTNSVTIGGETVTPEALGENDDVVAGLLFRR